MIRFLSILTLITLTACGFHPVYGVNKHTTTGVESYLAQIQIGNIPDREGQFLRNALIDRFYRDGRPTSAHYSLTIRNLNESSKELDITKDADSTRGQLTTSVSIALRNNKTNAVVLERSLRAIASYNILSSEFTNRVSEQNTRENTLNDLARQIEQHIALHFKREQ